jgi:amino acid transporter
LSAIAERAVTARANEGKGLRAGAIGMLSNTVIGIASVAPAYSLASALAFVVGYVGLQSPLIMLLAFIPMFMVAVGYGQLNKEMPDCGSTFTWSTKAFGPITGWMGGWAIVAADVIVMANLAQIAASYVYLLIGANKLATSTLWVTLLGVGWIVAMGLICYLGIEISARLQYALLGLELIMLSIFSITALVKVGTGSAPAGHLVPSASWFNPFQLHSVSAFTSGILVAAFIYWGWDTAASINEETKDPGRNPGRAMVVSTLVLLVTYLLVSVATQSFAGIGTKGIGLNNPHNSGDVLSVLGKAVFGSGAVGTVLAKLLVLMVLSSAAASTLTTILPTARTTLSMATYRAIPQRFARVHHRFQTPTWSTVGMTLVSIAFYVVMTILSTNVLADSISSLGLLIAFYYAMTGLACTWWYRRQLTRSARDLLVKGILPTLGGLILMFFFGWACYSYWAPNYGYSSWRMPFPPHWHIGGVFLTGIGSLILGVVLMIVYRLVAPPFFRGRTLDASTPVLVPEE